MKYKIEILFIPMGIFLSEIVPIPARTEGMFVVMPQDHRFSVKSTIQ